MGRGWASFSFFHLSSLVWMISRVEYNEFLCEFLEYHGHKNKISYTGGKVKRRNNETMDSCFLPRTVAETP